VFSKTSCIATSGIVFLFTFSTALSAAPRLGLVQSALTVSIQAGQNGAAQTVDTYNAGDGLLNLQASSSVTWLSASIGSSHSCSLRGNCIPVQIALLTSSLAKGTYTGTVKVSDPNAVDSPQFVTVTVQVGGNVPDKLEYYVVPGGTATTDFTTAGAVTATVSNSTPWLSLAGASAGSFLFNVPYRVTAKALNGMGTGDYNGNIALSGSTFSSDNKSIPVLFHITTQPILQPSSSSLLFQIAQGANKQSIPIAATNTGQGTLTVSGVTATAASGTWLTAQTVSGGLTVTADPTGLSPGTYQGTVVIASNAANGSVTVPVQLTVEPSGPPLAYAGGLVNNGTFGANEAVSQGDIVALFGDQLTFGDAVQAPTLPLPTTLGKTQVLVNNVAAPVYYVSPGQINFEIPIEATVGDGTIRVVRDGQQGNLIGVSIRDRVPHFILFNGYAIMTTPAGALTGLAGSPAKAGDTVVIYTIGLGPTSPSVPSGTASPGSPLARVLGDTFVCFGPDSPFQQAPCVAPGFVGLTPGLVGLYQLNVVIPQNLAKGDVPIKFTVNGAGSDNAKIALQ
jgi:uncharacterized protein (TIGR03437 family)